MFDMLSNEYGEKQIQINHIGYLIAIVGAALSIIGTLVNNLWLDHTLAMWIWLFSNPILLMWAIGNRRGLWDGGLSIDALIVMYFVFTITNFTGLILL
jgi:hypothetical protein